MSLGEHSVAGGTAISTLGGDFDARPLACLEDSTMSLGQHSVAGGTAISTLGGGFD